MRQLNRSELAAALIEARQYTNALLDDLPDARLDVPLLPIVNPFLWEWGHVGWFQEYWCLRWSARTQSRAPSMLASADRWYDSSNVPHDTRWTLDLPSRAATRDYLARVLDLTLAALERAAEDDAGLYFFRLALYHEDMHGEAFAYMRHTLGMPAPSRRTAAGTAADAATSAARDQTDPAQAAAAARDIALPGGAFHIGAPKPANGRDGFVFDNEKWSHRVELAPFDIASRPVTQGAFAGFVADGGYGRDALWSDAGRAWRDAVAAHHPRDWRHADGRWQVRRYDRWEPLAADVPVMHVNAHEAEAWCRWAGRRLPSEAEWEFAATRGAIAPAGVWEWTASAFEPYPGFSADPYADYSAPWFHTHRSVRGASFVTPARLAHPRFRNFYLPARNDFFAGFRTCALAD
jgi:iron(II)-dependent oxidoreductase